MISMILVILFCYLAPAAYTAYYGWNYIKDIIETGYYVPLDYRFPTQTTNGVVVTRSIFFAVFALTPGLNLIFCLARAAGTLIDFVDQHVGSWWNHRIRNFLDEHDTE